MEYINRIELQGEVGTIRINNVNNKQVASFSLATQFLSKNHLGDFVCETTWHHISAWEGKNVCNLSLLGKGVNVRVVGRIRTIRYTGADGCEKTFNEVLASEVSIVTE